MQTREDKIRFLKSLSTNKKSATGNPAVKHLDLSPANLPNITRAELKEYLEVLDGLEKDGRKDLPQTSQQVFFTYYNRIKQECKIKLLKIINPQVIDGYDVQLHRKFSFHGMNTFDFTDLIEMIEKQWGRKFNSLTDYPSMSEEEMKQFIKMAPPVQTDKIQNE